MFICICNGVTDSEIRAALADGATSLEELHDQLGVASQCGSCSEHALSLIHEMQPAMMRDDAQFYAAG